MHQAHGPRVWHAWCSKSQSQAFMRIFFLSSSFFPPPSISFELKFCINLTTLCGWWNEMQLRKANTLVGKGTTRLLTFFCKQTTSFYNVCDIICNHNPKINLKCVWWPEMYIVSRICTITYRLWCSFSFFFPPSTHAHKHTVRDPPASTEVEVHPWFLNPCCYRVS